MSWSFTTATQGTSTPWNRFPGTARTSRLPPMCCSPWAGLGPGRWIYTWRHTSGAAPATGCTAPLGHSWHMEGAYRWADPALSAPWLEGVPAPGWTVGVGWRSESGAEWRTALGITTGPGVDWEVAGRVGPWHVRQGLVAGGAWRPATSIGVQVPGTGLWLGLRAEEQAPLGWQLGGRAGKWTWSLHGGDAARGEARLGWPGAGPRRSGG